MDRAPAMRQGRQPYYQVKALTMGKTVSVWVLALVVFIGINAAVLFGWCVEYAATGRGESLGRLTRVVLSVARFPSLVHQAWAELSERSPQVIANLFPAVDGFKKNGKLQRGAANDKGYLLLSAYDDKRNSSAVKLIRIRDEHLMYEWVPDLRQLAARQKTTSKFFNAAEFSAPLYRIMHPLLMADTSLVFGYEGPLFKIDQCSRLTTVVDGVFHHAKELDADGNIWTSSVSEPTGLDKRVFFDVRDDAITKLSAAGQVLWKKSVSSILIENGYRGLLFGVGNYNADPIHLNAVKPALNSSKYWNKGDLLLSMRSLSTVLLYRPSSNKIVWLKTGPWLKQHSPDFVGQSKISVLGNDVIDYPGKHAASFLDGSSNIYLYDFADGQISTPYAEVLQRAGVRTITEGRVSLLDNGDAFVEETNRGRILRISQQQVIWEFTVKIDEKSVGMPAWSTYLLKEQAEKMLSVLEKKNCR